MSPTGVDFFPRSFDAIVARIGSLSDTGYKALRNEIENAAFDADAERCERISPILGISPEVVGVLLTALDILYGRLKRLPEGVQLTHAVRSFVDSLEEIELTPDARDKLTARLIELTAPKEKIELAQKIRRLRTGFLENATTFSSFVDLRPDFAPGYESVRALVPIIQLMITTDAEDVARRHLVFQLDERRLAGLRKVVEQAEKKLDTLRTKGIEKLQILSEKGMR
jgi:hypothetical protein